MAKQTTGPVTERQTNPMSVFLSMLLVASSVVAAGVVLADESMDMDAVRKGREAFLTAGGVGCAACHGRYAEGDVGIGPYNRGVNETAIRTAMRSVPPMFFLQREMTDEKIRQIATYYRWLGELQLVKSLSKRGRFIPDTVAVYPGTPVQLAVKNASSKPHTFGSESMEIKPFRIKGRDFGDVVWLAPVKEGVFEFSCTDCRIKGKLTVMVSKSAKRHRSPSGGSVQVALKPATKLQESLVVKGREVFLTAGGVGCVACHGRYAEGDIGIGSYNRGRNETAIRSALDRVKEMKFLADEMTDSEIKQVAAYYESLGAQLLVKTRVVRGLFVPDRVSVHPGTRVQLVVGNRDPAARRFSSSANGIEAFSVPGRSEVDFVWLAPKQEGFYDLRCKDCKLKGQKLVIEVTQAAPKFLPSRGTGEKK